MRIIVAKDGCTEISAEPREFQIVTRLRSLSSARPRSIALFVSSAFEYDEPGVVCITAAVGVVRPTNAGSAKTARIAVCDATSGTEVETATGSSSVCAAIGSAFRKFEQSVQ